MSIVVKFFAILKDRAGVSQVALTIAPQSRVTDACSLLAARYPGIATYISRSAYAVNRQYVPSSTELNDGDELALIPPVSGG